MKMKQTPKNNLKKHTPNIKNNCINMLKSTQQRIIISMLGLGLKHTQGIMISMLGLGLGLKTQKELCLVC